MARRCCEGVRSVCGGSEGVAGRCAPALFSAGRGKARARVRCHTFGAGVGGGAPRARRAAMDACAPPPGYSYCYACATRPGTAIGKCGVGRRDDENGSPPEAEPCRVPVAVLKATTCRDVTHQRARAAGAWAWGAWGGSPPRPPRWPSPRFRFDRTFLELSEPPTQDRDGGRYTQ